MKVLLAGATGDLAEAFIKGLLARKDEVLLTGRNREKLKARAETYGLPYKPADLAKWAEVQALYEWAGEVDAVFDLAGAFYLGPVRETPPEVFSRLLEANLLGLMHLARAFAADLAARRGALLGVAAAPAWRGQAKNMAAYAAAKSGALAFLRSLAEEEPSLNVLALVPMGVIDTPKNRAAMPDADFSRWITPEALFEAVVFALGLKDGRMLELPVYPPSA